MGGGGGGGRKKSPFSFAPFLYPTTKINPIVKYMYIYFFLILTMPNLVFVNFERSP